MTALIWSGTALSALGIAGIIYSLFKIMRAKKAGLTDDEMRAKLTNILPINLGALFVSMIGLMMVIIGVMLS